MLSSLLRLWGSRLLWFLLVAVLLVLLIHLITPYKFVQQQVTDKNGITKTIQVPVWSFAEYRRQVTDYSINLLNGRLPVSNETYLEQMDDFMPVVKESWYHSFRLFALALAIGLTGGVLLGATAAFGSRLLRTLGISFSLFGVATPDFFLLLMGQVATIYTWNHFQFRLWPVLAGPNLPRGWALPLIVLTIPPIAYMARLTVTAMDEIMSEDYIRTAHSKGLTRVSVVYRHALKNAIPRVLSGFPVMLGLLLSSQVLVERMTNWPGLARWLVGTISFRYSFKANQVFYVGITPPKVITAALFLAAWYLLMDGLVHTLRILTSPQSRGVAR